MPTVRRNGSVVGLGAVPLGSRSAEGECPPNAVIVDLRGIRGIECDRAMAAAERRADAAGRPLWLLTDAAGRRMSNAERMEHRRYLDRDYRRREALRLAGLEEAS